MFEKDLTILTFLYLRTDSLNFYEYQTHIRTNPNCRKFFVYKKNPTLMINNLMSRRRPDPDRQEIWWEIWPVVWSCSTELGRRWDSSGNPIFNYLWIHWLEMDMILEDDLYCLKRICLSNLIPLFYKKNLILLSVIKFYCQKKSK